MLLLSNQLVRIINVGDRRWRRTRYIVTPRRNLSGLSYRVDMARCWQRFLQAQVAQGAVRVLRVIVTPPRLDGR